MRDDPLELLSKAHEEGNVRLEKGSDFELAERVLDNIATRFGDILHTEGAFWRYAGTDWTRIADVEVERAVHRFDGAFYFDAKGDRRRVSLTQNKIRSVIAIMTAIAAATDFFTGGPTGINCASGFISFDAEGRPTLTPHDPDHRRRHTLPGRWRGHTYEGLTPGTLLHRLLHGSFKGDTDAEEKIALLGQVAGATALGYATRLKQPKAVVLKGETAENGKSQILDLMRALLPKDAIRSITPGQMDKQEFVVRLSGALLNAADELSSSGAIASDRFKAIVTGEPLVARDLYKSTVEFRPVAQNIFATNTLPEFRGGMDRGVQRRLLVIPFNRVIPMEERVEAIGKRIGEEEADLLLEWAVYGASELLHQGAFAIPTSSKQALMDWLHGADPVVAWLESKVAPSDKVDHSISIRTCDAFGLFKGWAQLQGYEPSELPKINQFTQRVLANAKNVERRRRKDGPIFIGLKIIDGLGDAVWCSKPGRNEQAKPLSH